MGNRASLYFKDTDGEFMPMGVYVHWNGSPESVVAFVDYFNEAMTDRQGDAQYGLARFVQIVGNFFGGVTSLGLVPLHQGDGHVYNLQFTNRALVLEDIDMTEARKHPYWKNDEIMKDIRAANNSHFKKGA